MRRSRRATSRCWCKRTSRAVSIKRVLAAWGVGSVELAQASVFATLDAEQIERVLAAVDTPGDLRRLRAALATDWLGLDAAALWRLEQVADAPSVADDPAHAADAMGWVERFSRYRTLWHERGFAVMWRTLMRELRVAQRLVAGPDGERRLTNVNHLAELVQARAATQPGIAPTLRWLAAQRTQGGGEDAQLRLESDRNLVQIVTVHKSKGLEYAVVFCPFLNDGALREPPSSGLPDAREYHDETGDAVLHYGCDDEEAERASRYAVREQAAERARLVYVALTRAVYRCYLVAGTYLSSRSTQGVAAQRAELAGGRRGPQLRRLARRAARRSRVVGRWQALAGGPITLQPLPQAARRVPLGKPSGPRRADAGAGQSPAVARPVAHGEFQRPDRRRQQSARRRMRRRKRCVPITTRSPTRSRHAAAGAAGAGPTLEDDILAFPRGAGGGRVSASHVRTRGFHRAADMARRHPRRVARASGAGSVPELAARLPAMMHNLIADVVAPNSCPAWRSPARIRGGV